MGAGVSAVINLTNLGLGITGVGLGITGQVLSADIQKILDQMAQEVADNQSVVDNYEKF